ncbi:tRNA 2-thiouridine(34) synthase MnmA [Rhodovibrio sodomensis]|uniref:tRNA-specific 2-thiouridylase MnmA n=1 Tax=Rhodovibrio sodomensis TaxID=1088 RepID=A0ABS1DGI2_9PROT|nr:tRNA 2-thiouridine(34) synthase MnmA [Rhodovibrio sodomensis]MBK1668495.1 tRNA 2-thiouridine(34) synthase MnmA [Rhodovibrio sodomensis]
MTDLGFDKPASRTRVVVAMSGGVDSSVTAALLARAGYEVVGVTLQLYDHGAAVGKKGACCAGQDIYDAKRVADRLGVPHYTLGYEDRFRESVIDAFADSYLNGETPIPCVRCNQTVKFRDLLGTARELDADALATGHYVRRVIGEARAELHSAVDASRDQSYFLFATTQAQLDFLRFPLGGQPKDETRRLAEELGLRIADKPDSQDICFVPDGDYASVVEKLRPGACDPGEIVDRSGNLLGRHDGIIHFTVGQRRGLKLGNMGEPMYVLAIQPESNRVVAGPRRALARDLVHLRELNWLDGEAPAVGRPVAVKLRSAMPAASARVAAVGAGGLSLQLDDPQYGVSPGQAAVCYDGTRVLGGGWIESAELTAANAPADVTPDRAAAPA